MVFACHGALRLLSDKTCPELVEGSVSSLRSHCPDAVSGARRIFVLSGGLSILAKSAVEG